MGKSPMMKKLIGKQENLPEELKAKIEASPAKTGTMGDGHKMTADNATGNYLHNVRKHDYDKETGQPKKKKGKSPAKKYKSDAQRKAIYASKAEKAAPMKNYKKGYYGA